MEDNIFRHLFPKGFRLLIVDGDIASLELAHAKLSMHNYKVDVCENARSAVSILRQQSSEFDLLLIDVHIFEINGFEFFDAVSTKLRIPIGVMSVDMENEIAMETSKKGACFLLQKPLDPFLLTTIWRYTLMAKLNIEQKAKSREDDNSKRGRSKEKRNYLAREDADNSKKSKREHVIWTSEHEGKFLNAYRQLKFDPVPSKIAKLMNVEGITARHVASHLQKYRLRLMKEAKQTYLLQEQFRRSYNNPTLMPNNFQMPMPPTATTYPMANIEHVQACLRNQMLINGNKRPGPCQGAPTQTNYQVQAASNTTNLYGLSNINPGVVGEGNIRPLGGIHETSNDDEDDFFIPDFDGFDFEFLTDELPSFNTPSTCEVGSSSRKADDDDEFFEMLENDIAEKERLAQANNGASPADLHDLF